MRYHLWTVLSSRAGPYGVLDSGAVTGAARPVPYCGLSGSGGCSEAYSRSAPLPLSPSGGSLGSGGSATGPLHCNVCNIAHAVFFVKGRAGISGQSKSQALNAHNFSLLVLSNFDKPTWPPSCPMVGSLRVFLFCSPCSAPLTSSPFDCPLCWFLPVTRSARSPAGTPGT